MNWECSQQIVELCNVGFRVCLVVPARWPCEAHGSVPVTNTFSEADFALSLEEAREIGVGALPPDAIEEWYVASAGRFVHFVNGLRTKIGIPELPQPTPTGVTAGLDDRDAIPVELLVTSLVRRGAYIDAFEVSVADASHLAHGLIDLAGPQYMAEGLAARLVRQLEVLPKHVVHASEDLMFWWFSARAATNTHGAIRSDIEDYLSRNEAAELRAAYAAAFPGPELLEETGRALKTKRTPVTLRMHGFALGMQGLGSSGLPFLMKALRLSLAMGDSGQVVASATDIANYHLRRGAYRDGAEWASWAVEQHEGLGGRDELRRIAALSLACYARILVGEVDQAAELAAELRLVDVDVGGPTSEAIGSTLGDWCIAQADLVSAETYYRRNLDRLPVEQYYGAALDLVPVLVQLGLHQEAKQIGSRARTLTSGADGVTSALGELAYGLSLVGVDDDQAAISLRRALDGLPPGAEAHRRAQASIAVAGILLKSGDVSNARRVLRNCGDGLNALGESGWRLLSVGVGDAITVSRVFRADDESTHIQLLGRPQVVRNGECRTLPNRSAECLAILAARPSGSTLQQLTLDLYGERGVLNSTKAVVSRLRDVVPILSNPYRLEAHVIVDYVEVSELISRGQLTEALMRYSSVLLPQSQSPAISDLRALLHEEVRQALLQSRDVDGLFDFVERFEPDDLELLERLRSLTAECDARYPKVLARIRKVSLEWGVSGVSTEDH